VKFASEHPNGSEYPITLGVQEDPNNGDGRIIQVVAGSQTATGFQIKIVKGDNGVTADVLRDEIWYYNVVAEIEVVTDVVIQSSSNGGVPQGTQTTSFSLNNFGDQGAFQLNFNAGSNPGANWEALLSNRPYNSLPADTTANINGANVGFTTSYMDNGDGTFNVLITGDSPLPDARHAIWRTLLLCYLLYLLILFYGNSGLMFKTFVFKSNPLLGSYLKNQ